MLTLVEAQKYSLDTLLKGVIETIVTESDVLKKLPFKTVVGNALKYNRENTLPAAGFYSVGDTWTESTQTVTAVTSSLTILGGDADVDMFEKQTLQNLQDTEAVTISSKSKAIARKFDDTFVYGDTAVNAKEFDGLHKLMPAGGKIHQGSGSTVAALSMAKLDEMIDAVKPGRPQALVMNKTMRRRIKAYYRGTSGFVQEVGEDGKPLFFYGDIPVLLDDWIVNTETIASGDYSAKTGGTGTSIFACKFGEDEKGVTGLQNGTIQKEDLGKLETKDAKRWRLKWYCGLALFSALALGRVDGIDSAAAVVV